MEEKIIYIDGKETNYLVSSDGRIFNRKNHRELKGTIQRNEYKSVQLMINGKPKSLMVHRLVATAFCENPNNYTIVDHIDRNKFNNKAENLRWVSERENSLNHGIIKTASSVKIFDGEFDNTWKEIYNNYMVNSNGVIVNKKTKRISLGTKRNGYIRVSLNGSGSVYSAHKIIWETFNGPIPEGYVIDHIDGNRSNNALSNLRLITQAENMQNAQILGHNGQVKISQYDLQGNFIAKYNSIRQAANTIGGNEIAIKDAANRHGTSAGCFWIREDQNITIEELLKIISTNKPKSTALGVTQYSPTGQKIKHYSSLKEASREIGCGDSTIKRAADAKRIGKGFYWILDTQNININDLIK